MADLDSRAKRASSVNIWKPWMLALVLPDASISLADRQHIVWDYAGISPTAVVAVVSRSVGLNSNPSDTLSLNSNPSDALAVNS